MDSSQDTEITLGTAKLLALFFGLVMICAVFFALGYTLGRKSDVGLAASAAIPAQNPTTTLKPATSAPPPPPQPMTFYKAVEQKDANAQLTPATAATSTVAPGSAQPTPPSAGGTAAAPAIAANAEPATQQNASPPDPLAAIPAGGYFVQVAAVSKQEDAQALVDALKAKQYPAFIAASSAADKLFRVQMGPFNDMKEAEDMRTRLINDGYNPILKK
jgi:DedD protein